MDARGYQDREYLRRHYAGQALIGLLAADRLQPSLDAHYGVSDGVNQFAALTFKIADAMVDAAIKHSEN